MTDYQPGVISLLVPTRGRPIGCQEMWLSALDTADDPLRLQLVLYLDEDDPTFPAYHAWIGTTDYLRIKALTGPRIVLSETWNRCWAVADGEILWFGNDDIRFHTDGWDQAIREAFAQVPDRIAVVHGRDGIHDGRLATLGFFHQRWAETLGRLTPPYFSCDWVDAWNSELADRIDRRMFLPGVYIEHLHPVANKAPWDDTHRERMARGTRDGVDALFRRLEPERAAEADRLRQRIDAETAG